jgi:hypothetical protein
MEGGELLFDLQDVAGPGAQGNGGARSRRGRAGGAGGDNRARTRDLPPGG